MLEHCAPLREASDKIRKKSQDRGPHITALLVGMSIRVGPRPMEVNQRRFQKPNPLPILLPGVSRLSWQHLQWNRNARIDCGRFNVNYAIPSKLSLDNDILLSKSVISMRPANRMRKG